MNEPVVVRRATLADIPYMVALGRREFDQIGFVPISQYEGIIGGWLYPKCRVWVAEVNGDVVGFLYSSPGAEGRSLKVLQIAIQEDARRIEYGKALVDAAEVYAAHLQRPAVSCSVATDIEARRFWDALGYAVHGVTEGGKRRKRLLERRYKRLECGLWIGDVA